ncbi:hypothetical protein [Candidatus Kuenenia sp.]|uniref:hypothetical protein n=1 Tax=Candidatus Kuenenia sp. TaxID=2499824 RepID=UPI00321F6A5F
MEFITTNFENLIYIYEHIFWLKECLTLLQSSLVFLLVLWILRRKQKIEFLLYLSACVGIACVYFGDNEYWSDNDILKFIAPAALYFFYNTKGKERNAILFAFLTPYSIISYEFYRGLEFAIASMISHSLIIFSIIVAKNTYYLSLFISVVVGLLFNYIGVTAPPSTSELFVNPALITLATIWLEIYKKNPLYTNFLKIFWITLICFAYFGSWFFYFIQPFVAYFFQPNLS